MRVPTMLVASILVGVGLLAGCSTIPLTTAASMRVEVEVYKGPLSKTVPVQWGELEGLVDVAGESLKVFRKAICSAIAAKYTCIVGCNSKAPSDDSNSGSGTSALGTTMVTHRCNTSPETGTQPPCVVDDGSIQPCSVKFMSCEDRNQQPRKHCRNALIGYHILSHMHEDTELLWKDLGALRKAIERHNRKEFGCHVDQLASCDERPLGECGTAGRLSAGATRACLETARRAARVIRERDEPPASI